MKFTITGSVGISNGKRKFKRTVDALSEAHARDKIYALFGSNNRLSRGQIKIDNVAKGE